MEVGTYLTRDWDASIAAYDKVHEQAIEMAGALSSGTMKQFPEKVGQ